MEYSVLLYYPNIIGIYIYIIFFYIKRLHYISTFSHLKFAGSLTLVFVHCVKSMLRNLCLYDKLYDNL